MPFLIRELTSESVEDATAYWLYADDEGFEQWRLVPGSQTPSPSGRALRLEFELEGDRFQLALIERDADLFAKFDDHEHPEQEFPVRAFESDGEAILTFAYRDQTVFVWLELCP